MELAKKLMQKEHAALMKRIKDEEDPLDEEPVRRADAKRGVVTTETRRDDRARGTHRRRRGSK